MPIPNIEQDARALADEYVRQIRMWAEHGYTHLTLVIECNVNDLRLVTPIKVAPVAKVKV